LYSSVIAAAQTSCQNQQDKSSYYWPVLRVQDGSKAFDQNNDGGGKEGNVGKILVAKQAQIKFVGSPTSKVVAMPQFLRIITGDAKTTTNGLANANAHWSCTGFENKVQLHDKYPICPQGSKVKRIHDFPRCWDGKNLDSPDHKSHMAYPSGGHCPSTHPVAIPAISFNVRWKIPPEGAAGLHLASDMYDLTQNPGGFSAHGDWWDGWDHAIVKKWMANCVNAGLDCRGGIIADNEYLEY